MRIIEEINEENNTNYDELVESFKEKLLKEPDRKISLSDINNGFNIQISIYAEDKEKYAIVNIILHGAHLLTCKHEWDKLGSVLLFLNNAKISPHVRNPLEKVAFEDSARPVARVLK